MRPLLLEIAGLHSFRERRTIDFEPLLRDHLFGIFGPTGGGKSTILDAMTLALFGKIERTRGQEVASAINSRAKECSVALTFSLRRPEGEGRYRVERLYKIQKSGIKSEARLVDLSVDPPVTLADKAKEVTAMVEEILGIKSDDFRLSVVLPQGAFAEFLHLPPKDRGEMLQRIFGLEGLGRRINDRLRELRGNLESRRTGIEARLESLNEYNDEALNARHEELKRTIAAAEEARAKAAEGEERKNAAEELHELIVERDRLLLSEEERRNEREQLATLQTRLLRAEEALALEGIVKKRNEADARRQNAQTRHRTAEEECRQGEERIEPLRRRRQEIEKENAEGGRLMLLEKQVRELEGTVETDDRILLLARSAADRSEKIEHLETALRKDQQAVERMQEEEEKALNAIQSLKKSSEELEEEGKKLARHAAAIDRLTRLAIDREEKREGAKKIADEETELTEKLRSLKERIDRGKDEESAHMAALETTKTSLDRARIEQALGGALTLLHDGEPCPLCGAFDHPHPYSHAESADLNDLGQEVRKREQEMAAATQRLRSLEKEDASLAARLSGTQERRKELEQASRQLAEEMERSLHETEYKGETDAATLRNWGEKIAGRISRNEEERTRTKEEMERLEEERKGTAARTATKREEIARNRQATESEKGERDREQKEIRELRLRRQERLQQIGIDIPEGKGGEKLTERRNELHLLKEEITRTEEAYEQARAALEAASREQALALALYERENQEWEQAGAELEKGLKEKKFNSVVEWEQAVLSGEERQRIRQQAEEMAERLNAAERRLQELTDGIGGRTITAEELDRCRKEHAEWVRRREETLTALGKAEHAAEECATKNAEWKKILAEGEETNRDYAVMKKVSGYLQGNAFINFLADEHLQHICRTASNQLLELTGGRLAIGSRSDEGFFIRDNGNGGTERPPGSLSGGETFLVSLALSLALSDSLQTGQAPMEFFFLDEGFGTLDDELLETVLDSLERLRATSQRAIGVISHIQQLRQRIPRRLLVTPAGELEGTDVRLEVS